MDPLFASHPLTIASEFVRFTMLANYWYALAPSNVDSVSWRRGVWYDRQAGKCLARLSPEQQQVAYNLYNTAYKCGRRWGDYL